MNFRSKCCDPQEGSQKMDPGHGLFSQSVGVNGNSQGPNKEID